MNEQPLLVEKREMLTKSELEFLSSQGLDASQVFDAKGRAPAEIKDEAKRLGKKIILGVPCAAAGHRLRTRYGHCAQCKPANLGFQNRAAVQGDVYIAVSPSLRWTKVGSTTNRDQRFAKLNFDAYGTARDWKPVFWVTTEQSGKIELDVHRSLSRYGVEATYVKDGKPQVSRECFKCSAVIAMNAVVESIRRGRYKTLEQWMDQRYQWK